MKKEERESQEEDKEGYKEVEEEEIQKGEKVEYQEEEDQEKFQNTDSTLVSQTVKYQDIVPSQDQHTITIEKLLQVPEDPRPTKVRENKVPPLSSSLFQKGVNPHPSL